MGGENKEEFCAFRGTAEIETNENVENYVSRIS